MAETFADEDIPRTLQDAIRFTATLGEKYLWIDRSCIVQDDHEDVATQLDGMGPINSNAQLALVALTATSSNSALPGIEPDTRLHQHRVILNNLCFWHQNTEPDIPLKGTVYSTRGWTFQEQLLSTRKLYFMEQGAWFECRKYSENDVLIFPAHRNVSSTIHDLGTLLTSVNKHSHADFKAYARLVADYTSRTLSVPCDIEFAFAGLVGAVRAARSWSFTHCLPEVFFFDSLLFSHGAMPARRRQQHNQHSSIDFLPSWTWTGWEGRIIYPKRAFESNNLYDLFAGITYKLHANVFLETPDNIRQMVGREGESLFSLSLANLREQLIVPQESTTWPQPSRAPQSPDVLHITAFTIKLVQLLQLSVSEENGGGTVFQDSSGLRGALANEAHNLHRPGIRWSWGSVWASTTSIQETLRAQPSEGSSETTDYLVALDEYWEYRHHIIIRALYVREEGTFAKRLGSAEVETDYFWYAKPELRYLRII